MTRRTRSILLDNTFGKIYTDSSDVVADPTKVIAGAKAQYANINSSRDAVVRIAYNLGATGRGIVFPTQAVVTKITLTTATAPTGSNIIIAVKTGTSYSTATQQGTYSITPTNTSSTNVTGINVPAGNSIFTDVIGIGSLNQGTGLSIQYEYYSG
jgi:hypothetical protein